MTRRQRTLLFLLLFVSFLVTAPALALYSQGYRLDLKTWQVSQTGAFYFKVAPTRADVLVDGELVKRTDFLFGSALTKNFFPGTYFVEIVKEGYHSWQKILEVKERSVTEAKNILLFKKAPVFQQLIDNVERFWVSPNRQYALLQMIRAQNPWEIRLLNLQNGGSESLLSQTSPGNESILDIQWAQDSEHFLLQRVVGERILSHVYSTSSQPCSREEPCDLGYLGENIGNIKLSPADPNLLFFTRFLNQSQALFSARYQEKEAPAAIANNVVAYATHGNSLLWLDKQGILWQQNRDEQIPQVFQESTFAPKQETSYTLTFAGDFVLANEGTTLHLHERDTTQRREILSLAREVAISPDGRKAAISNSTELWVLFVQDETEQPKRQTGDMILLTRFSEPMQELSWIDSSYLLFALQNSIRTIEVDSRDRTNTAIIATFPASKLFFDNEKGALYVLTEGGFSVSEKLVR